jgi:hypothetical protein
VTVVAKLAHGLTAEAAPEVLIGADHAEPLAASLSALPVKRALFAVDSYFRDGWDDLLEVVPEPSVLLHTHATLLLKPDAVAGRRLEAALDWLLEQGALVVAAERIRLDRHTTRAMWWYQWNVATRERRELADALVTAGESLLLVARLPDAPTPATLRLSNLKGPADPAKREPWQLRQRLDNDNFLINFVHTADEPADLIREFGILLDGPDRRRVFGELQAGEDQEQKARGIIEDLYRRQDAHDLSFAAAQERRQRDAAHGPWDEIVIGTTLMTASVPDKTPLLAGVSTAQWEHRHAQEVRPLRYDRTVPYGFVHKTGTTEVLVTDHARVDAQTVVMAGEIPVAHRYFSDLPPSKRLDLVPVLELCRQGCYVLGHGYYGAPDGARFILRELSGRLRPDAPAVSKVRVEVTVARAFQRDGRTTGLALDYKVTTVDGEELATAKSSLSWMNEPTWTGIRTEGRTQHGLGATIGAPDRTGAFPAPRAVGRTAETNVLLADPVFDQGVMTARLAPDPGNQAMFEHPQDHIPGMVLIEAARQAALWTLSRHLGVPASRLIVTGMDSDFRLIGELDLATECTTTVTFNRGGRSTAKVTFVQAGAAIGAATIEVVRKEKP